jgi:hypothetical protein
MAVAGRFPLLVRPEYARYFSTSERVFYSIVAATVIGVWAASRWGSLNIR